jgi:hypothetical protein
MKKDSKLSIGLFQEIPLYPTLFKVDVWVCNDLDNLSVYFHNRYGRSVEYYKEELTPNQVSSIETGDLCELKNETRIVMNVYSFNLSIMVHELNHVVYHLSKHCGLETNYESQEWVSYMLEYLVVRCSDRANFKPCVI